MGVQLGRGAVLASGALEAVPSCPAGAALQCPGQEADPGPSAWSCETPWPQAHHDCPTSLGSPCVLPGFLTAQSEDSQSKRGGWGEVLAFPSLVLDLLFQQASPTPPLQSLVTQMGIEVETGCVLTWGFSKGPLSP